MAEKPKKKAKTLERREFLKLSAVGTAASLAGCVTESAPVNPATTDNLPAPAPPLLNSTEIAIDTPPTAIAILPGTLNPSTLPTETWQEPWLWRPERWPQSSLELNVVRNQNPGPSTSPGNTVHSLYSYNGASPAPTIRVKNTGEVNIRIRNTLGLNLQQTPIGAGPDPVDLPMDLNHQICELVDERRRGTPLPTGQLCIPALYPEELYSVVHQEQVPGWSLKGHINGLHAAHVTNLHTHGLHVEPVKNSDGSHSDNVKLRILSQADWEQRQKSDDPNLHTLADHEHVGQLDYRIRLGFDRDGQQMPHPPGTHWYHPHAHGSTHDQVSSGMAGFLIVEGDVDESINMAMTGESWPDPEQQTGAFDYRERLMFLQRVFAFSADLDAGRKRNNLRFPPGFAVNGAMLATTLFLRPGAVERWRILNGSVDGAGTKRFMVLRGEFVHQQEQLWRVVTAGEGNQAQRRLEQVTAQELEDAKMDLQQLSFDGITLVTESNGKATHTIRDLSRQNANTENPFKYAVAENEADARELLRSYEACFKDGDSLRRSFIRPNEVYLGNANRADVFFKVPLDARGEVFTVFAQEAHIHADSFQGFLQNQIGRAALVRRRPLFDVVMAYISVRDEPVEGGDFDIQSLIATLPAVPPLLQPVREEELRVGTSEARQTNVAAGSARTRVVSYSGTGGADFPIIDLPRGFTQRHADKENLLWSMQDGVPYLLPNYTHTMAINPEFDLAANPQPDLPRKFMPDDPKRPMVLVNTAEEWALYNNSSMLWSHTDLQRFPQHGSFLEHYRAFPISRADGQERFWEDSEFRISSKGVDHPFHIHINPIWVLRIDVPDEHGELHNILPEPRWMDTVSMPRNGGRVVFRSRFDDFVGKWVNHCHILLHEDNGMMQEMECTDDPGAVNYKPRQAVASFSMSGSQVDEIYPKPSLAIRYKQSFSFIDPNETGYQVYPDFELDIPNLEET